MNSTTFFNLKTAVVVAIVTELKVLTHRKERYCSRFTEIGWFMLSRGKSDLSRANLGDLKEIFTCFEIREKNGRMLTQKQCSNIDYW